MFENNAIIKASAGTGKTFALATRFIRLMLLDRVRPETIVALTFSRAAAQEIYTKILDRLCAAAASAAGAEREWKNLLADFKDDRVPEGRAKHAAVLADPPPHAQADFEVLLRKLVDTQHLGAIATLDSFILRIVQNFPKEMGFQNVVSVLDPFDESEAVEEAVRGVLAATGETAERLGEIVAATQKGEFRRQCLAPIGGILSQQGWRDFVLAHPDCRRWTVDSMCAALGVVRESACPDFSAVDVSGRYNPAAKFVEYARQYDGSTTIKFSGQTEALVKALGRDPTATSFGWTTEKGQERFFEYGEAGAAELRAGIRHLMNLFLAHQLEIVRAKIDLVLIVEAEYNRRTRRMGKLTFGDFTSYSADRTFSERGIALQNVEFRFDAKFDHWALDEFQDTSELQWRCLEELVQNVADAGGNGEARSAMVVGDMKQSIYTWRGASAQPFEALASWPAFDGCARDFSESHRYGPAIAEFVNRVFGTDNIQVGGLIPAACAPAVATWRAGWRDHVSHEPQDYVKVVAASPDEADEADDAILPVLAREIGALWQEHERVRSGETVGVLVRGNAKGLVVADYLRSKGLPVVWEGMNPVSDMPVVQAILALLKLSCHPSDTAAWQTVDQLIDIRRVLYPDEPTLEGVSEAVARELAQKGLARTLKDYALKLLGSGRLAKDGLTGEKLRQLVKLGVDFEVRPAGDGGMDAFLSFIGQASKRELAVSADVIRVLTIHRSKGLGIDHVFVPLFEGPRATSAIDAPKTSAPLQDGGAWVLSHLPKGTEQFNERTRAAYERMRSEKLLESLRTYYVALTRAKRSMYVIFPADPTDADTDKGLLMRDLVVHALGADMPCEIGRPPELAPAQAGPVTEHAPWPALGARRVIERVSPSRSAGVSGRGLAGRNLFAADFGMAVRHGVNVHAAYQAVEWADEKVLCGLPPAFHEAFVKPTPEATVWRERSYELFDGRHWETGQFDRVVFTGSGDARSATIYDFKTNAKPQDLDAATFADRLRTLYAPQLTAYRLALSRLTGIPPERIAAKLLVEAIGRVVSVSGGLRDLLYN